MDPDGNSLIGFFAGLVAGALGFGQLYSTLTMVIGIARSIQAIANGADPKAVIGSWLLGYAISAVINPIVNSVLKGISGSGQISEQHARLGAPTDVSDYVEVNSDINLSVTGNTLNGSSTYSCSGSVSFCGKVADSFTQLQNYSQDGITLQLDMTRVSPNNKPVLQVFERAPDKVTAKGAYLAYGEHGKSDYRHANIIRIKPNYNGNFSKVLIHEAGHWMGLAHQIGKQSIMSYHYLKPVIFSGTDLGRLRNAYR